MKTKPVISAVAEWSRKTLSFVLIVLFALVVTTTILGRALTNTLTSPGTYDTLFRQTHMAQRGQAIVADFIVSYALRTGEPGSFVEEFPLRTWETVAQVILPVDWLDANLHATAEAVLDWLDDAQSPAPDLTLDLSPVIETLRGPQGSLAILPLLQSVPPCTADVTEFTVLGGGLVSCLPRNQDLTVIAQRIASAIADYLPKEVSVTSLQEAGIVRPETIQAMGQVRARIRALDAALILGVRLSLLILSLCALLQSSSLRRLLKALAVPLYAAGGLSLLLLGIVHAFLRWGLGIAVTTSLPLLSLEAQALLADSVRTLGRIVEGQWLYWSASLVGAALLAHMLSYGLNKVQRRLTREPVEQPRQRQRIRKQFR